MTPDQLYRTASDGKQLPLCGRPTHARYGRQAGRCKLVVHAPGDACVVHDPVDYRARCMAQLDAILRRRKGQVL